MKAGAAAGGGAADSRLRRSHPTEEIVSEMFRSAGISINGSLPSDIQVHDGRFFQSVMAGGTLGFGESYMDGWWDCGQIDEMCCRAIRARVWEKCPLTFQAALSLAASIVFNLQSKRRARRVGRVHYDLGNDFFVAMLDPWMQYSCGYFKETGDLADAQQRKLDLICKKLALRPGMRVLDIGCGWGGFARYAAENHGCQVVGITISSEQQKFAEDKCRGLPVEIRLQDYREVGEAFDCIVSVGMMEHVGYKNHRTYLETTSRCLSDGGRFLCQTIAGDRSTTTTDPWIERYIFPNSMLPSAAQITRAADGLYTLEDVQNFGADYDRTLLAWERNFSESWEQFAGRYGERFRRMWRFYLLSCAGAFRARSLQLFQFLFSKGGLPGGFSPVR